MLGADLVGFHTQLSPDERRSRMRRMQTHVGEHNVYRWAAMLLEELERMPRVPTMAQH